MKTLLTFLIIVLFSFGANSQSKYKLPFDLWECSGLATDSKEVLKLFKAIAFKDDKTKQLLYLRANALASMYEAYCKK